MKRLTLISLAAVIILGLLGSEAMAVKVVTKSSTDSSQTKTLPPAPNKPSESKSGSIPTQPAAGSQATEQKPKMTDPVPVPTPPRDNFIDRDNDGINDNIKQNKEPEIKREKIEPSKPKDTPKKSEPVKKIDIKKDEERKTSTKKH